MENMETINTAQNPQTTHDVPKCTCCGNVGAWKVEPLLTGKHWVIGIIFMFLGFLPGVIYLGAVALMRANKNNRAKICPKCKAQNLFTFIY